MRSRSRLVYVSEAERGLHPAVLQGSTDKTLTLKIHAPGNGNDAAVAPRLRRKKTAVLAFPQTQSRAALRIRRKRAV